MKHRNETSSRHLKVVVVEINEISWELIHEWLQQGDFPHFARIKNQGTWARTVTNEPPGLLEPWVTWTTFHTGVPQPDHGVQFLEQPSETIRAKRLWEIITDANKKVGVFGSVGSWPPKPVNGFFIPGSFSPDAATFPKSLEPIQELNVRYTRAHVPGIRRQSPVRMISDALGMIRFGFNLRTAMTVAAILAETKIKPDMSWKNVSLQPIVNMGFFKKLYRQTRPDFCTFHTNHVAHYQHRFFRAWRPKLFPDPTEPKEIARFGDAIHFGYRVADSILGEFLKIADSDEDTVLCVASSMGQKPWVPSRYDNIAPLTCRIRSIERLIEILGIRDKCEFFSTMAPQWNIRISDRNLRQQTVSHLNAARYEVVNKPMYSILEVADSIVVTPVSYHGLTSAEACSFPTIDRSPRYSFDQLVVQADETRKSGCHDPVGLIAFYGRSVIRNSNLGTINTLDVAPTLLSLMGLPVPSYMKGNVLRSSIVVT